MLHLTLQQKAVVERAIDIGSWFIVQATVLCFVFFLLPILLGKVNYFCAPISLSINIIHDHSSNPASFTEVLSSSREKKKQKLCLKSFKKFKVLVSSYWILHRYFLSLWGFSHIFCVLELDEPDNNLIFILHKYVREANIEYFTQA